MPKGVYHRKPFSEGHRRNMSEAQKGKHPVNEFKKGYTPWNKGTDGLMPPVWNKGTHGLMQPNWNEGLTKETSDGVRKHSEALSENAKVNPNYGMKGKHHTEKTKNRLSETHEGQIPWMQGKHHTEKTKGKLSEYRKGKHPSEESRRKMRDTWQNPEHQELARKNRLKIIIPSKDTSIELKLQQELASRSIQFQKHLPITGQPDIAFSDKKIAIFADGDYWHTTERGLKRDALVNEKLRNDGWLVLRYWEHEINMNTEAVVDEIEEVIKALESHA